MSVATLPHYRFASSLYTALDMQRESAYVTRLVQLPVCHPSVAKVPAARDTVLASPLPQLASLQPAFQPAACTIPAACVPHVPIPLSNANAAASLATAAAADDPASALRPSTLVAAAVSDHSIKLYVRDANSRTSALPNIATTPTSTSSSDLSPLCTLKGHRQPIHDLQWYNQHSSYLVEASLYARAPLQPTRAHASACTSAPTPTTAAAPFGLPCAPVLVSASQDGTAIAWDVRSGRAATTFRPARRSPLFAAAAAEHLVVAGGEGGTVFVWDIRTGRTLHTLADFHSDDVSCIAFHPLDHTQFFTGSLDNLLCRFDSRQSDPNEWCQDVYSGDNAVARIGFFGPRAEFMYAHTTIETMSLWSLESGQCFSNFQDLRQRLAEATQQPVDYLIDCHYDVPTDRLLLACGDNNGGLVFAHVRPDAVVPIATVRSHSTVDWNRVDDRDVHVSTRVDEGAAGAAADDMHDGGEEAAEAAEAEAMDGNGDEDGGDGDANDANDAAAHEDMAADDGEDAGGAAAAGAGTVDAHLIAEAALPGHVACVRGIAWCASALIVTGAQDSRICCWSTDTHGAANASSRRSKPRSQRAHAVRDDPTSKLGNQAAARNRFAPY